MSEFPRDQASTLFLPPHCVLSQENHIHLPFSSQGMPSLPLLCQLMGSPPAIFFCLVGSYTTSKGQIQGPHFRMASLTAYPTLTWLLMPTDVPTSGLLNTVLTPELIHTPHSFMTYLFKTQTRSSSRTEALSQLSGFQNASCDPLEGHEIISVGCNQQRFLFFIK